ncbi:c-type cytochrome biogenesis protein CcmI [Lichenihabitans psoromatis]|uniref:c-type cytochrome biogenesis protein CcmI n=1 Tax=Lichenihabitans psoromatis TaxID=2528642 RepID=UPI0010383646|nr:c-type cytochrome biogenesis protein CcmI [Lichenihabitans psoromatis]
MVWIVFALMTAAVVLCLVWPLARTASFARGRSVDVAFYRGQLGEVDDDIARGLVKASEADATRAEIARRLLLSDKRPEPSGPDVGFRKRRLVAVVASVVLVPVLAIGLYVRVGRPEQPDMPIASRAAASSFDLAAVIPKIEARLAADPNDGRGFSLIAPIYFKMGRYDDAARAYAAALRILGENAERRAALGQALVMAADGVVTAEARVAFEKALSDDPTLPQARFFAAAAAEQDGNRADALMMWRKLAADASPGEPWLAAVKSHIAGLETAAVERPLAPIAPSSDGPATPAGAVIAALPVEQQQAAIRSMVDGLAARLVQNGHDPEGWLRLVRAYSVLGDADRARESLAEARKALSENSAARTKLDDLAHQLGLEG